MEKANTIHEEALEILKKAKKPIKVREITLIIGNENCGTYPPTEAMYRLDEILRDNEESFTPADKEVLGNAEN